MPSDLDTATDTVCPVGCQTALEPLGRWAPYRVCPQCGTGFWRPPPRDTYWGEGVDPGPEQESQWASRDALRTATVGSGPGRLLDVGCGFGHFVGWAVSRGWDAWGFDDDEWAIERNVMPDRVVSSLDALDGTFDLITLWDVLEHVPEPVVFLRRLRRLASEPGGRITVASPNFAAMKLRWPLLKRRPERFADVIRPDEHALQLTVKGTRLALERSGFGQVQVLHPPLAGPAPRVAQLSARLMPSLRRGLFVQARAV